MIMISRERSGLIILHNFLLALGIGLLSIPPPPPPPRPPRRGISLFEALLFCFGSSLGEL